MDPKTITTTDPFVTLTIGDMRGLLMEKLKAFQRGEIAVEELERITTDCARLTRDFNRRTTVVACGQGVKAARLRRLD